MNSKALYVLLAVLSLVIGPTTTVNAASQDECAIWLCLPGGFPSGCGAAKDAMKDRIKDFKSPLPSFSSCVVDAPNVSAQMESQTGWATMIQEKEKCVEWHQPTLKSSKVCVKTETIPAHMVKEKCFVNYKEGTTSPPGCNGNWRYVDVFLDGEKTGETYYW